jgi:NADP-dependent 3-hydroxy acid dehydrogenase YdfG
VTLLGRAALITGGARMGEAIAATLAGLGADVAFVYRASAESAERAATTVRGLGRHALTLRADLADPLDCHATVNEAAAALGRLDVMINMASIYRHVPFDEIDAGEWDRQMAVDLRATFLASMAAVPHMRRQGGGRIVNFTDWVAASGRPRYPGYLPYYVAKAGVKALTEALALELAADRTDRAAGRHERRGTSCRGARHAAGPLGGRGRDREGGGVPVRERLRDRRDHPGRRRAPREITPRARDEPPPGTNPATDPSWPGRQRVAAPPFSVTFCTRQLVISPTSNSFSLRQSIELASPNSFGRLPALPNLPTTLPSSCTL